jgi:2-aminoadipate transaminase
LFLWLRLPDGLSADQLLPLACQEGTAFAPGRQFFPDGSTGDSCIRLNFAMQPPTNIEEGIRRIGRAMEALSSNQGPETVTYPLEIHS